MIICGIDFSINSTALVINNSEKFLFYSFVPNYTPTLKAFKFHKKMEDLGLIKIISYQKQQGDKDPIKDQKIKLSNAEALSAKVIEVLEKYKNEPIEFRIEGFSYSSSGSSFIDLIIYNTFLKSKLVTLFGVNSINVIAPKTNKKIYTGNGNANKCQMIRKFIEEDSLLSNFIKEEGFIKEEDFTIPKPLDDLVDAYALTVIKIS